MTRQQQIHALISGQVQGVSFRYRTVQAATTIGCTGWVRNNPNGTVECIAQGTQHQLQQLIDFLHIGSPAAHVTAVQVKWQPVTTPYDTFAVTYHR